MAGDRQALNLLLHVRSRGVKDGSFSLSLEGLTENQFQCFTMKLCRPHKEIFVLHPRVPTSHFTLRRKTDQSVNQFVDRSCLGEILNFDTETTETP